MRCQLACDDTWRLGRMCMCSKLSSQPPPPAEDDKRVRYGAKIEQWMKAFPKREQLQLVQVGAAVQLAGRPAAGSLCTCFRAKSHPPWGRH